MNGIFYKVSKSALTFDVFNDLCRIKLIVLGCHDGSFFVFLTNQGKSLGKLCFCYFIGVAENYTVSARYLIIKEFAEILHIHFALASINNDSCAVKRSIIQICIFNRFYNVAELSDT